MSARQAGRFRIFLLVGAFWALGSNRLRAADTGVVTVKAQNVTAHYEAYAQVEPVALLPIRAMEAGTVEGLGITPGATVRAGQKLGALGGPAIHVALVQADAAVEAARARLAAAGKTLAILRGQLASHLATQQTVADAEAALAAARGEFAAARARLEARRRFATVTAPVAGLVLAVEVANGTQVASGDTMMTLQPADSLWARAVYYGSDAAAVRPGMAGRFVPADGGDPTPVTVAAVFAAQAADGGRSVGLLAARPPPGWRNGESGTVILDGPTRALVAVPTRALVLDQGRWWVLLHTAKGDQRRQVMPAPARGWQTYLEHGLAPGDEVVVENAYLRFHQSIAKNYQPPD